MPRFPRRLMGVPMIIVLALSGSVLAGGQVAAKEASPYGYGVHSGNYGRHWVLDMYDQSTEYAAVACRYDHSLKLRSLSIRPPVVFADDRTSHLDHQHVAWRAVVEYSTTPATEPWSELGRTHLETRSTTDEQAASFHGAVFSVPGGALPSDSVVRVTYRMWWYSASTGDIDGRASDGVYWLRIRTPFGSSLTDGWCEAGELPAGTVEPYGFGTHEGHFGDHWILDGVGPNPEYPAVTCVYSAPEDGYNLTRLRIRGPIILAYDRTDGSDTRYVGWKARIQEYDGSHWVTIGTTSTSKAKASDTHWPTFQTKSHDYDIGHVVLQIRVVYLLFWYASDGHTVVARATHYPKWYARSTGGKTTNSCPNHLLTA